MSNLRNYLYRLNRSVTIKIVTLNSVTIHFFSRLTKVGDLFSSQKKFKRLRCEHSTV